MKIREAEEGRVRVAAWAARVDRLQKVRAATVYVRNVVIISRTKEAYPVRR
mgnify:CR=1 FL=1